MKKVMVFGTFDGIHQGHLDFFKQAKKHGDYLVVAVAQDNVIKKLKSGLPKFSLKERVAFLKKEKIVDKIIPGDKKIGEWNVVKKYKPDIVAFGYDQLVMRKDFENKVPKLPHKPKIVLLKPFKPNKYHSSILKITC